jgi:glutamine synthetase
MVSEQLRKFKIEVDELIADKKMKKDDAIFNVLREYIKKSKSIRFEGDGYSDEWVKEAKKRGLSNLKTTPEALKAKVSKENIKLLEDHGVLTAPEVHARYEIELEEYMMKIQIEGRVLGDIATNHVIPTAIRYQNTLIENVSGLKDVFGTGFKKLAKEQMDIITDISERINAIKTNVDAMINERKKANKMTSEEKKAKAYCEKVKPYFDEIRLHCDKLEMTVDDELWPLTKYRELLFTK